MKKIEWEDQQGQSNLTIVRVQELPRHDVDWARTTILRFAREGKLAGRCEWRPFRQAKNDTKAILGAP